MHAPLPPYRIKVVEPIPLLDRPARLEALDRAGFNLFRLRAKEVSIDLLTDSGTGAMSARQWAAAIEGDESYAGSPSFERFEAAVRKVTGMKHVLPVHQGRAAERLLCAELIRDGDVVISNTAFDTTRANIELRGGRVIDLPHPTAADSQSDAPFKGDIDLAALERALARHAGHVAFVILTITNNAGGGQPMHPENAAAAHALCRKAGVPLWIDAARFAENAALAAAHDPALRDTPPLQIARSFFEVADGAMMSLKKDGLAHIGGFLAVRDDALAKRLGEMLIATEGFLTYGGLAGRDLDAIAAGLDEVLEPGYLAHRLGQIAYLAAQLEARGVPVVRPAGGHAVFVDAGRMLPHLAPELFPGHALACALYVEAGIRSCEIGTLMFGGGKGPREGGLELLRLAIPRRAYETAHLDYIADALGRLAGRSEEIPGFRILEGAGPLRHFSARLAPLGRLD